MHKRSTHDFRINIILLVVKNGLDLFDSNDAMQGEHLGLVYHCRVQIDHTDIQVKDKWVNLSPGMSVMVEIKTGKRKLIEYFLSPIMRYKQEAIRER